MSKRNFILLIIVLVVIVLAVFWVLLARGGIVPFPGVGDGSGTNFISQFNPFGSSKPDSGESEPSPTNVSGSEPIPEEESQKLSRVSSMPVAGFGMFQKERFKDLPLPVPGSEEEPETKEALPLTEFAGAVRYVERATGNVYQTFIDKIDERKFSTTLIPKIYEARFGNKGESVVMRYLKEDRETIETFVGDLPKEQLGGDTTSQNEIVGSFLPENVREISVSPDTSKVFYLFTSGDGIVGTILNLQDGKKSQVFDSPFTEWLSLWPEEKIITLSTKPSWNTPGYLFTLNPKGGGLTKILGDINGLTTLASPDGKLVLYSNGSLSLSIYHTDTRDSAPLGIRTLAEKCVWGRASSVIYCAVPRSSGAGEYPDVWYRGEVSFGDQFWKIDVESGNTTLVLDPFPVIGADVDGTKLALDESEGFLLFVNKKDSFLWKIDLK